MSETIETRNYTGVTTQQIVDEMLKESTGQHFLDSGGAYGRNWERNQGKDFEKEPNCGVDWMVWRNKGGEGRISMSPDVSLYHWMVSHLEFDAELQGRLEQFMAEQGDDWNNLGVMEEFADQLYEQGDLEEKPTVINTYNHPDNVHLSQVLQYVTLCMDGECDPTHLLISVHGGCDVRGGYGSPKAFRLRAEYFEAVDHMAVREMGSSDLSSSWYSDSGCWTSSTLETRDDESRFNLPEDVTKLPVYDLDWIESPACRDLRDALAVADRQRAALVAEHPDKAHLVESLDRTREVMKGELKQAAVAHLIREHGYSLLLIEKKLWLVGLPELDAVELDVYVSF